jgi:O-antigen biosynthesis protein
VAVEDLAIGHRVVTEAGWLRRVKWIGRRSYDGRFIAGNYEALPIVTRVIYVIAARGLW